MPVLTKSTRTFLEYVLTKYLGTPIRKANARGMSYWPCPKCDSPKFHTLPDVPHRYKHYAKCHACGFWGDVMEMLKHWLPNYDDRLDAHAQLKQEYEQR